MLSHCKDARERERQLSPARGGGHRGWRSLIGVEYGVWPGATRLLFGILWTKLPARPDVVLHEFVGGVAHIVFTKFACFCWSILVHSSENTHTARWGWLGVGGQADGRRGCCLATSWWLKRIVRAFFFRFCMCHHVSCPCLYRGWTTKPQVQRSSAVHFFLVQPAWPKTLCVGDAKLGRSGVFWTECRWFGMTWRQSSKPWSSVHGARFTVRRVNRGSAGREAAWHNETVNSSLSALEFGDAFADHETHLQPEKSPLSTSEPQYLLKKTFTVH